VKVKQGGYNGGLKMRKIDREIDRKEAPLQVPTSGTQRTINGSESRKK
jgi:hypothetical protein